MRRVEIHRALQEESWLDRWRGELEWLSWLLLLLGPLLLLVAGLFVLLVWLLSRTLGSPMPPGAPPAPREWEKQAQPEEESA
jgi:hypothetical protein